MACCGCALAVDWDSLRRGKPAGDGSIDGPFIGPEGGSDALGSDASPADVTLSDVTLPADGGSCSPAAGCYQVPLGWGLAAIDLTNTGSCPAGFEGTMVVADPVVGPGSCQYGPCTVQQQPVCGGNISSAAGCLFPGGFLTASVCEALAMTNPFFELRPGAPGGTCVVPVTAAPIPASAQACTNPGAAICDGGACHTAFPSPFLACIEASGAQTCPPGTPFTERHTTAVSATNTCPAATCTVTTTCGGTLNVFSDDQCKDSIATLQADGNCYEVTGMAGSLKYTPGTSSASCATVAPQPATVSLVGERTFCCTP